MSIRIALWWIAKLALAVMGRGPLDQCLQSTRRPNHSAPPGPFRITATPAAGSTEPAVSRAAPPCPSRPASPIACPPARAGPAGIRP